MEAFEDIYISDATVLPGVRPAGRSTNNLTGRKKNGLLYIWSGEAVFWECSGQTLTVQSGGLIFIPKGCCYKMQYTAPNTTFVLIDLDIYDKYGKDFLLSKTITILARDDTSHRIAGIMTKLELCGGIQSLFTLFRRKELIYKLLGTVYEIGSMPSIKPQKYPMFSKPQAKATSETVQPPSERMILALSIRKRFRYCMGDIPYCFPNRDRNKLMLMPLASANLAIGRFSR